jgi:hypothetical protein
MNLKDAWAATEHGHGMIRPSGARLEKWISDKPGLAPGFERYIENNIHDIQADDLVAQDWEPE